MAQKVTDAFQDGGEPSMDVINTIIASYAASTCGESEAGCAAENSTTNPILNDSRNYRTSHGQGLPPPRHSTPIKNAKDHRREQEQQMSEFVHPLAMKIQKEDHTTDDNHSNAATDQSDNRSEGGESYREITSGILHSINVVTKKLNWATKQLEETSSLEASLNAVKLISECANSIANLKKARPLAF